MRRPRPATFFAVLSWLAVVAAAVLDPTHDPLGHYVSWLSKGRYWGLAAVGIASLAVACVLTALRLHRVLPSWRSRQAAATFLACAAVLALSTLVLPSRGHGEPAWRTVAHVALAVGGYAGVVGAALVVGLLHALNRVGGPHMTGWAVALLVALAMVGLASVAAQYEGGLQVRGLAQLGLLTAAVGWLLAAQRVRA